MTEHMHLTYSANPIEGSRQSNSIIYADQEFMSLLIEMVPQLEKKQNNPRLKTAVDASLKLLSQKWTGLEFTHWADNSAIAEGGIAYKIDLIAGSADKFIYCSKKLKANFNNLKSAGKCLIAAILLMDTSARNEDGSLEVLENSRLNKTDKYALEALYQAALISQHRYKELQQDKSPRRRGHHNTRMRTPEFDNPDVVINIMADRIIELGDHYKRPKNKKEFEDTFPGLRYGNIMSKINFTWRKRYPARFSRGYTFKNLYEAAEKLALQKISDKVVRQSAAI